MIEIVIQCNKEKLGTSCKTADSSLPEVSAALYALEQIKLSLLSIDFKKEFEVNDNGDKQSGSVSE